MLAKTATSAHALPTKRQLAAKQAAKADIASRQAARSPGEAACIDSITDADQCHLCVQASGLSSACIWHQRPGLRRSRCKGSGFHRLQAPQQGFARHL